MTERLPRLDDGGRLVHTSLGTVHARWLRDACSCTDCRRPSTNERLLDTDTVGPEVRVTTVAPSGGGPGGPGIVATFADGHVVDLDAAALIDGLPTDDTDRFGGRRPWPAALEPTQLAATALDTEDGLRALLAAVRGDGLAIVTGVEPTDGGLRNVAERIGPIRSTNYGETWAFEATGDPTCEVDSQHALRVHTDLPYRSHPPGLQLNLAIHTTANGGASTFVDGWTLAERLRAEDHEAWDLVTSVPFHYPYRRNGAVITGGGPLVERRPDGRYGIVRRAPDLVGSPTVTAERTDALFAALRRWNELVDGSDLTIEVALSPGELVAFDNHRLLHGRTAFDLGPGERRVLAGCYLDTDDLVARLAELA